MWVNPGDLLSGGGAQDSGPLNNTGLDSMGPLTRGFFSIVEKIYVICKWFNPQMWNLGYESYVAFQWHWVGAPKPSGLVEWSTVFHSFNNQTAISLPFFHG